MKKHLAKLRNFSSKFIQIIYSGFSIRKIWMGTISKVYMHDHLSNLSKLLFIASQLCSTIAIHWYKAYTTAVITIIQQLIVKLATQLATHLFTSSMTHATLHNGNTAVILSRREHWDVDYTCSQLLVETHVYSDLFMHRCIKQCLIVPTLLVHNVKLKHPVS